MNTSARSLVRVLSSIEQGAIIGFFAALLSSFGLFYFRRKHRRNCLRSAILTELEEQDLKRIINSLEANTEIDSDTEEDYPIEPSDLPPADSIPTSIYEENAGNIGRLPKKETEEVVEYYTELLAQKSIIRAIRNGETVLSADKKELHERLPEMESNRTQLVTILEKKL